jgi:Mg2+/Co2+ transporter CorB
VVLVFSEVIPKTFAALHPERFAFPATAVLVPLLRICYPVVWLVNLLTNGVLAIFGIRPDETSNMALSREELRTVVQKSEVMIPPKYRQMLSGVLDLEKANVEDIMVPRAEITGLDLENEPADLQQQLINCRHTRLPVFRGNIDATVGILHVRSALRLLYEDRLSPEHIEAVLREPYYLPLGTPLHTQLGHFQKEKRRVGLVVDEYGNIQGLVSFDDLLEEIVGEYTTDPQSFDRDVHPQPDGSYVVDGTAMIREVNRATGWSLPTDGPKTRNGLILEALENIPEAGTGLRLDEYTVEILQTTDQSIRTAKIMRFVEKSAEPEK